MKALPWYFGSPSEVILTRASCCDGLHYGVHGLWGSAPTSPTWGKIPVLDWLTTCQTPQLRFTPHRCWSKTGCIHEYNELFKMISPSKSTVRDKHIVSLNDHHFHITAFHILQHYGPLQVDPDSTRPASPRLAHSFHSWGAGHEHSGCPGGKGLVFIVVVFSDSAVMSRCCSVLQL